VFISFLIQLSKRALSRGWTQVFSAEKTASVNLPTLKSDFDSLNFAARTDFITGAIGWDFHRKLATWFRRPT
jgi:hypothetical protein